MSFYKIFSIVMMLILIVGFFVFGSINVGIIETIFAFIVSTIVIFWIDLAAVFWFKE